MKERPDLALFFLFLYYLAITHLDKPQVRLFFLVLYIYSIYYLTKNLFYPKKGYYQHLEKSFKKYKIDVTAYGLRTLFGGLLILLVVAAITFYYIGLSNL